MWKHAARYSAPSKSTGNAFVFHGGRSWGKSVDLVFAACNGREKEEKAIHSFNTHPKPPYGSQIQCGNMLQNIQRHPKVLATRLSLKGAEVDKSRSQRYLRLAVAVKRRRRPSIPSIPTQSLHMGPKYNVETCCKVFSGIQKYWRRVCLSRVRKSANLASR